jgi:hypothetical protein
MVASFGIRFAGWIIITGESVAGIIFIVESPGRYLYYGMSGARPEVF